METKPYHLMTPAERTAQRIRSNREIEERAAHTLSEKAAKKQRKTKKIPSGTGGTKTEVSEAFVVTRSNRWGRV